MLAVAFLVFFFECGFSEVLQSDSLVYPELLEERGLNGEMYLRINEDLTLELEKSTILARNFALIDLQGDDAGTTMVNGTKLEENLYHNDEHMSSLVVIQSDDGVEVEGILKHNLRIRPLPTSRRSSGEPIPHEVHEIPLQKVHHEVNEVFPVAARNADCSKGSNTQTRILWRDKYIYEIMVVVDKQYQCYFSRQPSNVTRHVMTFMNSVKRRFSRMRRPRIRLAVVGIARVAIDDFQEFTERGINGSATLTRFVTNRRKYFNKTKFDAVLILTGWNIIGKGITGHAFPGTVCTDNAVAIVEDDPLTYEGVQTAAIELCHILGAANDGDPPLPNIPGHPGARRCNASDHYLMGERDPGSANFYKLSKCTEGQIRYVLSQQSRYCLQKASTKDLFQRWNTTAVHGVSRQVYCKRLHVDGGSRIWEAVEDEQSAMNCQLVCCKNFSLTRQRHCARHPMLDGQLCVRNKTCKNGVCGHHIWH